MRASYMRSMILIGACGLVAAPAHAGNSEIRVSVDVQGLLNVCANGPEALARVDLSVRGREIVTVVGESGCGKSTLLRVIAGLEEATNGTVSLFGQTVTAPGRQVPTEHRGVAMVFQDQTELAAAFDRGEMERDLVAVVRFQGPAANGMPELHSLTPILSNLQDQGHALMLITDGRMSGASGRVPAAIHLTPEAMDGGAIGQIQDGDMITLDAATGVLSIDADLTGRPHAPANPPQGGFGRELFSDMRDQAASAEDGGGINLLWRYQ